MHSIAVSTLALALWAGVANAHLAAFAKGMYCLNGSSGSINLNSEDPIFPLYELEFDEWWFHHTNNCDEFPPDEGDFLELPAGGSFTVEIAANQAYTTLSWDGKFAGEGVIGTQEYSDDLNIESCITTPNIHTQNKSMTAGTAFTIAYTSELSEAKPENMVVFTVRYHTPWKRITSYDVPAAMPACPDGGCICAWNWIPNGCGQSNIYHQAFRCKVTGATSTVAVGTPQPPVWCQDDSDSCVKGPKQGLYWHQASGNNIEVEGTDDAGEWRSPAYNDVCGFSDGAQNDIFGDSSSYSYTYSSSSSSSWSSTADSATITEAYIATSTDADAAAWTSTSSTWAAPETTWTSSDVDTWTSTSDPAPTATSDVDTWTSSSSDPAPTTTSDVDTWTSTSDVATSTSSASQSTSSSGTRKCKRRVPEAKAKRNDTIHAAREHRRNTDHVRHWGRRSSSSF